MRYQEIAAPASLKKYIQCFWLLEKNYSSEDENFEELWADTHIELIIVTKGRYYLKEGNKKKYLPAAHIIGLHTGSYKIYADEPVKFVAVRLHAWGGYPFFEKPVSALVDNIVTAKDHLPKDFPFAVISGKQTAEENIEILSRYFQHAVKNTVKHPEAIPLARYITKKKGCLKISELVETFNLPDRQLQRIFLNGTGVSAKVFAKITRFNTAKRIIETKPDISLAKLTYETGYADQAHFSKQFKDMYGYSPAEFKRLIKELYARFEQEPEDVVFLQDSEKHEL